MAGDFYVYPAKGQNEQKTQQDESECQHWATNQSGFNPTAAPPGMPAAQPPPSVGRPVLGGAVLGAIVGEIASDNAGRGAAWGATAGLLGGVARRRSHEAQSQQQMQAVSSQYAAERQSYNNAYSACLTGRGYTLSPK